MKKWPKMGKFWAILAKFEKNMGLKSNFQPKFTKKMTVSANFEYLQLYFWSLDCNVVT